MAYTKDGNSLLTQVVDIPMGGGKDDKTHKQLFQPPFLATAKNIDVDKTGSVQKRDGIQSVIPSSVAQPYPGTGTLFEHPAQQLGIVGQPDFSTYPPQETSVAVVRGSSSFVTSGFVPSNVTGVYACDIEEDPLVRIEEALLHVQTSVVGNKVLTVWCSQHSPVTKEQVYQTDPVSPALTDNRCYYMIKERDTGTVIVHPTRLEDAVSGAFDNNPRYTHISVVDSADPHWVIVAAPDLYPEANWEFLGGASISTSTYATTYSKVSFIANQSPIERFVAFDMHAGEGSTYAHILAQSSLGAGHGNYLIRIDKTLAVSQNLLLGTNAQPYHSGAIYHDVVNNFVFTAVSNQDGIAGALPGDGECWVHRYDMSYTASAPFYPKKLFAQTIPGAFPGSHDIGITGACTRLTICPGTSSSLYVFGTQFWDPTGYARVPQDLATAAIPRSAVKALYMDRISGSRSMLNVKWVEVQDAFTNLPSITAEKNQPSCYITTKAFKGSANSYPMVGLSVTNGDPTTTTPIRELASDEVSKYSYKYTTPGGLILDPIPGNAVENQPSKHPMGVVAAPLDDQSLLRPVARFGSDLIVECEDVFPYETGIIGSASPYRDLNGYVNEASRWLAPGLNNVNTTEIAGEHLFAFKSRLLSGVRRITPLNRFKATTAEVGVTAAGGTVFSANAAGAFGGEEVRLNLSVPSLTVQQDGPQTYFSGGYLGFFDGTNNGESDTHSSPGKPYVQLYSSTGAVIDPNAPPSTGQPTNFALSTKSRYTFTLVYAIEDYDGRVHRSAPSPVATVYSNQTGAGAQISGVVALRYLMPPPSAFFTRAVNSLKERLFIEVYAKVEDSREAADFTDPTRSGAQLSVGTFTLIDRFEPEMVTNLQQGTFLLPSGEKSSATTPWSISVKNDGQVRSGFAFFGERLIYDPLYFEETTLRQENVSGALTDVASVSSGQFQDLTLYTEGGVIENDPPPAFKTIQTANKRMWAIPSNNRSSVWFSKFLLPGKSPEWTAAFTLQMPRGDDELTALSSMDEKVIVFSRSDVFIIIGEGPNNLGRGGGFTGPRKVASDVGCVNKSSVVAGPFGVMFQSERGIYVLTRDLQVSYIGSRVEDQITSNSDVSSAVLVENRNQVRFTLNTSGQTQLKTLCYDYLHQVWTVYESDSSVVKNTTSSIMFNANHTVLGADNYVSRDTPGSYYDGNSFAQTSIVSSFTTAWVKLAGLQGFKRVKRAFFLGQHLGGKVSLSAQYNYNEVATTSKSWTNAEIVALSTDPMQLGLHIPRQKCESIRFIYSDKDIGAAPADGGIISSITIQFGAKNGMYKMSEGSKK